jgi:hypothetical protein
MTGNKFALLVLIALFGLPAAQAQVKHIEMRVEGMT